MKDTASGISSASPT